MRLIQDFRVALQNSTAVSSSGLTPHGRSGSIRHSLKETIVDLRQHVTPIRGQQLHGVTGNVSRPRRVVSMVAIIVAALLVGAAVGRVLPTKSEAVAAAQTTSPASQPAETFVYFPSQYENQAKEVEEYIQPF
jgi:hypothetical protein